MSHNPNPPPSSLHFSLLFPLFAGGRGSEPPWIGSRALKRQCPAGKPFMAIRRIYPYFLPDAACTAIVHVLIVFTVIVA